jgi:HB1, ASXL, restriction endonuclease HTH domain
VRWTRSSAQPSRRCSESYAEIEYALRRDNAANVARNPPPPTSPAKYAPPTEIYQQERAVRHDIPPIRPDIEPKSDRFFERTITHATAVLLRESGGPLHVNEIYNKLLEGGFQFTGQNPTISIAVSLNRNNRFRKVAPGTFDLVIRDAAQAS